MNTNNAILKYLLFFSAVAELCGAFPVPPCSTERYMTRGIAKNDNNFINPIELGLFRPHQNHYRDDSDDDQQCATRPKVSHAVKRISQKLKIIRSFLSSFRFSSVFYKKKRRCLSILAAVIIAAGTFPSRVIAEPSINNNPTTSLTKIVATNICTTMDSEINKSMAKNKFLQYDTKAPNNYFEDVQVDCVFDTNLPAMSVTNAVLEKIDSKSIDRAGHDYKSETTIDGFSSALPIAEDVGRILTTENNKQPEDDLLVLNDKMVKNGVRNIAVLGSGTAALLLLTRKYATRLNSEDDNNDARSDDRVEEYDKIIPLRSETNAGHVADLVADEGSLLPLLDQKYVDARKQPKPPKEKAILAARYAAIPTVEERAYQILVDLGMIEVGQ
jgi:hypothetical protein